MVLEWRCWYRFRTMCGENDSLKLSTERCKGMRARVVSIMLLSPQHGHMGVVGIMSLLLLCSWTRHDATGHVPTSLASLLLHGQHNADDMGLCAHVIGVM